MKWKNVYRCYRIGLGLSEILDKRPDELSGGQAQRTAIGRALVHKPKIILGG